MDVRIGLDDAARHAIAQGLGRVLGDTFTLYLETHRFHWNVKGPRFTTLHQLFMEQYTELWNALDEIAERILTLGFPAPGTPSELSELSSIEPAASLPTADGMLAQLLAGHEALVRTVRTVLPLAQEAGDESTAALLSDRLVIHEKTAWMLRAMLAE